MLPYVALSAINLGFTLWGLVLYALSTFLETDTHTKRTPKLVAKMSKKWVVFVQKFKVYG